MHSMKACARGMPKDILIGGSATRWKLGNRGVGVVFSGTDGLYFAPAHPPPDILLLHEENTAQFH